MVLVQSDFILVAQSIVARPVGGLFVELCPFIWFVFHLNDQCTVLIISENNARLIIFCLIKFGII